MNAVEENKKIEKWNETERKGEMANSGYLCRAEENVKVGIVTDPEIVGL